MSNDERNLPRVVVRKSERAGSIEANFKPARAKLGEGREHVERFLDLADDWTSYCISSLQFVPAMSHLGHFFIDQSIDEDVFTFLKSRCISSEERKDEVNGDQVYSFVFHEEDLKEVTSKLDTTTQMMRAADSVKRSVLASLVAEFDYFMSRFLRLIAVADPDKFIDSSEKVTIGELKELLIKAFGFAEVAA